MYYPEKRLVSRWTTIRRKVLLPEEAIGRVRVSVGQAVDIRDQVARGLIPERHIIIEAAQQLRLRKPADLEGLLLVDVRARVEKGQVLAGRSAERGRRVFAPEDGLVVFVGEGRIILQKMPQILTLEAGIKGRVTQVYEGRGVLIEARGAVVQGIWGNGKKAIAVLHMEPEEGLEHVAADTLDTTYKGDIIVTRRPLTAAGLEAALELGLAGVIAPSAPVQLLEALQTTELPVLLTEGFGSIRMSGGVQAVFSEQEGLQAALDAVESTRFNVSRPEVVMNRSAPADAPASLERVPLRQGMRVRITCAPYFGQLGTVVNVPAVPLLLDNGLRVMCAQVDLLEDEPRAIPLANLELAGG